MTIFKLNRSKIYKICLLFLSFGLLSIFSLNTILLHTHFTPDGKLIAHSHPVSDTEKGSAKHEHTNAEYYYYYSTEHYDKINFSDFLQGICVLKEIIFLNIYLDIIPDNDFYYCSLFRAPPSC